MRLRAIMYPKKEGFKSTLVHTRVRQAASTPSASKDLTDLRELIKDLSGSYHEKLRDELKTGDGRDTAWSERVEKAVRQNCDSESKLSVAVCYDYNDYRRVLAENPDLVEEKSAKTEEARQPLSETPTVSEPSVAEEANPDDYHFHRGRHTDSEQRGTCTASDGEGDDASDCEEGEDWIKPKRNLSETRIERIRARRFAARDAHVAREVEE
jgi:hypothetical protein